MKIVLTRSMLPADIRYIKDGLDRDIKGEYELVVPPEFTEEGISSVCSDADVLLGPYITSKIIENAKRVKLIQVPWTGMDTFDFSVVKDNDITVCNTHSNAAAVAEIGVAMVLDLLKKLSYHDRKMRNGSWNRDQQPLDLRSKLLCKQTLCVLGFGKIGSAVGRLVAAFGAKVIAVDDGAVGRDVALEVFEGCRIKEAVSEADIVICTLPLTDRTRGSIDSAVFAAMKDGTVFVNISRAAVVDEDALWDALQCGKLGAFGADVWWNAPKRGESYSYPSEKHRFWEMENVLMSPHRAGFIEGCLPHLDGAVENIIALSRGDQLTGIVDKNKGY